MTFVLDSNILIHILRKKRGFFDKNFKINEPQNRLIISAVSIGELRSIALKNDWQENKMFQLKQLFEEFFIVDIHHDAIYNLYAEIETFSQGKNYKGIANFSSRNMGKNDLWIAATASVFNATLLTTDKDFDHLNNIYLRVPKIDLKELFAF